MKETNVRFLAKACKGKIKGEEGLLIRDVKIDSRECKAGDMFVCVVGEKNNGHDYIKSAYRKGCRCFLVSEDAELPKNSSFIVVKDTVKAFCDMAEAYLAQFNIRRIAVTGSVGKTTTKMLTAAVFASRFKTICTKKNLNTDLGIALTSFDVDDSTEAAIFEMGMDKPGEIAGYVKRVKPELAIITNIGISHLERLKTRDAIADAKLEITNQFDSTNVLVVNAGSDYLKTKEEIRSRAKNKEHFKIVSVGQDVVISNVKTNGTEGIEFKINDVQFSLPLLGAHNAIDAALAVSAGVEFGIPISKSAAALSKVSAAEKRLKLEYLSGIILIDDSYNASPDSVVAGIGAISGVQASRRILVLGDMLELGSESESGHFRVGKCAAESGIDMLIAFGKNRQFYKDGLDSVKNNKCEFVGFDKLSEIKKYVPGILKIGDAVLVKGSNSTKISEVSKEMREQYNVG